MRMHLISFNSKPHPPPPPYHDVGSPLKKNDVGSGISKIWYIHTYCVLVLHTKMEDVNVFSVG
jgi:hypothetical protein